jgi:hypothetical protein
MQKNHKVLLTESRRERRSIEFRRGNMPIMPSAEPAEMTLKYRRPAGLREWRAFKS